MLTTRMRLSVLLLLLEKEESHTHKRMPPSPPWSKRGERGRGNGRGQERGGRERHEAGARETQRQERRTTPDASLEKIAGNALDKAGVQRCTIDCDAYSVVRKVCYIFKMVTQDVHDQAQTLAVWRIQNKKRFLLLQSSPYPNTDLYTDSAIVSTRPWCALLLEYQARAAVFRRCTAACEMDRAYVSGNEKETGVCARNPHGDAP